MEQDEKFYGVYMTEFPEQWAATVLNEQKCVMAHLTHLFGTRLRAHTNKHHQAFDLQADDHTMPQFLTIHHSHEQKRERMLRNITNTPRNRSNGQGRGNRRRRGGGTRAANADDEDPELPSVKLVNYCCHASLSRPDADQNFKIHLKLHEVTHCTTHRSH